MAGKETVQLATFEKWPFKEEFKVLELSDDGQILKLQCRICAEHFGEIRQEAKRRKIKGTVLQGIVSYVDGTEYIHRTNVSRHIKSRGLHDWAKQKFAASTSSEDVTEPSAPKKQRIDVLLSQNTRTCYTHYFHTALSVVVQEWALSSFKALVDLQRKNGVHFLTGKDDNARCREFVTFLAKAMEDDVKAMLKRANFMSGMLDGSQARKTGTEKELIYAKIVVNGCPTELLLKCQNMADFGGEDAQSVKKAFDGAFLESFDISEDRFTNAMISVCADGASVNMGKYSGACTKMREERPWLLVIHCSNHRLELAVKDAFQGEPAFQEVDDTMMQMFYMFRNSGKAKRLLFSLALVLGVTCVNFVKATGTRFQNHKYRALKAMVINFLPLCLYLENMIENPRECRTETVAKLRGYLSRFLSYKHLAAMHLYRQVLQQTAHLSYVMQTPSSLITDVVDAIRKTQRTLQEISESEIDLPFQSEEDEDGSIKITAKGTNLPASSSFREKHQLTEKQKKKMEKLTKVTTQEYKLKKIAEGKRAVEGIKTRLIPAISEKIEQRFASFLTDEEVYNAVQFLDHTCWDHDDREYGIDKIKTLSEHFAAPLEKHGYSLDRALYEFRGLKVLVHDKYRSYKSKLNLWGMMFLHHAQKFPHILLLVELCLTISISSSTVERGFSTVGRILSDSRLSLRKEMLDNLLFIRVNITAMRRLDQNYDDKLVQKAIDLYLSSSTRGRYQRTKTDKPVPGPATSSSQESEDTFLPTPFTANVNPLLEEEGPEFAAISDTDSDSGEDSHMSEDSDEEEAGRAERGSLVNPFPIHPPDHDIEVL